MSAGPTTPVADRKITASRRRILARTRLDFWLDAALRWRWIVGVARRFASWHPGRSR